jgi:hypothetical protein
MRALLILLLCVGCGDKSSDKSADAGTDAGHSHAGAEAHDAAMSCMVEDDEDGGEAATGERACKLLCEDRVNREISDFDECMPKCTAQWASLPCECQLAAIDYGECATTAECTVVAECCYSEIGRYADQCPLDFQG